MVATVVLAMVVLTLMGGLLYGMKEARRGKDRAAAASWVQAELDYLRLRGYSFLADDFANGTRTLYAGSGYTSYGNISEPVIPEGFDRAVLDMDNITDANGVLFARRLTIRLYETPESSPYTIVQTYVTDFRYESP